MVDWEEGGNRPQRSTLSDYAVPWELLTKMLKLSTLELSHSPWQVRQRHGFNHIWTKVSTLGKRWRKNSLQGSFLRLDSSVQNPPLLLFHKGLITSLWNMGRDSRLCCRGAQTIVLKMLDNYIFSAVVWNLKQRWFLMP